MGIDVSIFIDHTTSVGRVDCHADARAVILALPTAGGMRLLSSDITASAEEESSGNAVAQREHSGGGPPATKIVRRIALYPTFKDSG